MLVKDKHSSLFVVKKKKKFYKVVVVTFVSKTRRSKQKRCTY
jgi:hypothetical protein